MLNKSVTNCIIGLLFLLLNGLPASAQIYGVCQGLTCGTNADGRIEVFAYGNDNQIYHKWEVSGGWSSWSMIGGNFASNLHYSNIAVANNSDGRLEAFVCWCYNHDKDFNPYQSSVEHAWQTAPNGGFSSWMDLGGTSINGRLAVVKNSSGFLEVFGRTCGSDFHLVHCWQSANGTWSGWGSLDGKLDNGGPVVKNDYSGNPNVFIIDQYNMISYRQFNGSGTWGAWTSLGGNVLTQSYVGQNTFCVEKNSDGRLEIFAIFVDHTLWHIYQQLDHTWNGSSWFSMGTKYPPGIMGQSGNNLQIMTLTTAINSNKGIEIFAKIGGLLGNIGQKTTGGWSDWTQPEAYMSDPTAIITAAKNNQGGLEFFVNYNNYVYYNYQVQANGIWQGWKIF